jgi:hypothetical protein
MNAGSDLTTLLVYLRGPEFALWQVCGFVIVAFLAVCGIVAYRSGSRMQGYRAFSAALFTVLAIVLYSADQSWNAQNVLIGLAVIISIAAIVVPPLRHHAPKPDSPEATHHAGHA